MVVLVTLQFVLNRKGTQDIWLGCQGHQPLVYWTFTFPLSFLTLTIDDDQLSA